MRRQPSPPRQVTTYESASAFDAICSASVCANKFAKLDQFGVEGCAS